MHQLTSEGEQLRAAYSDRNVVHGYGWLLQNTSEVSLTCVHTQTHNAERLARLLAAAGLATTAPLDVETFFNAPAAPAAASFDNTNLRTVVSPQALCYLIYTSGSTGAVLYCTYVQSCLGTCAVFGRTWSPPWTSAVCGNAHGAARTTESTSLAATPCWLCVSAPAST